MKQSIIVKTIIILTVAIIAIFGGTSYLFNKSDQQLIDEITQYNLNSAMKALDDRLKERLALHKKQMSKTVAMVAKNSNGFLLDFDHDGLKKSLQFDMQDQTIKAVQVWDSVVNEVFLTAVKKNGKINFNETIPNGFEKFVKIEKEIFNVQGNFKEKLGSITLYYDESLIKRKMENLKSTTRNSIEKFNKTIEQKKQSTNVVKMYILVGSMIALLVLITLLLLRFVNKPLQILHKGLDDFFLFLQSKKDHTNKIDIDSKDEFGAMAKSLNENISVSAKLHEEIHELNKNLEGKVEEKTQKVTTLLDNAGQGFLTFDSAFIVDDEYSKECEKLISDDIANKNITDLLFKDERKKDIFKETITNILNETIQIKLKAYLSLLPSVILLNKKAVKLEYKILNKNKVMMILTNITSQKKLEKKIKKEQETLKMIVAVVSESEVFYETKKDYEKFLSSFENLINKDKTPLHNITEIYRTVHTYKGVFSQLFMQEIVDALHELESDISLLQQEMDITNITIVDLIEKHDLQTSYNKTILILKEILGSDFLDHTDYLKVDLSDIQQLQEKITYVLGQTEHRSKECEAILSQVQKLSSQKLSSLLHPYISSTSQLALRLHKELYDMKILGDEKLTVDDGYKPFVKSLVHLFRNCVDHGIELPEERLEKNKDEKGTITCSFEQKEETLVISISDDGAGIDIDKLKNKLIESKIDHNDLNNLTDQEILQYIFADNISTSSQLSHVSGRGVGLAAVKYEVDKLNGSIDIKTQKDMGTTFIFNLPI